IMPRMCPPQNCEPMLGPMQPVNHEIDDQDGQADSRNDGQSLKRGDDPEYSLNLSRRAGSDQPGANAVDDNGEHEREDIQLQLSPPVERPGRSKTLPQLEDEHQQQEHQNLVVVLTDHLLAWSLVDKPPACRAFAISQQTSCPLRKRKHHAEIARLCDPAA